MEDVGIDEAFLDISRIDKPAEEIAQEIKRKIRQETGLTCSIGIAPNKLLAKIASDMQKPDGLTIITGADIEGCIWPLTIRKLPGVGPKTEAYLNAMGINTIGELASLSLDELIERLGESHGRYLYEASRGLDESPLITHWEPKSASRETTFEHDVSNWHVIARTLSELTRGVVTDLKEAGYRGRIVTVKVRFNDFETHTRTKTLAVPTNSIQEIRIAAFDCLQRFELKKKVRLIGVKMGGLEKALKANPAGQSI